jgi:hypothetical protein
MTLPLHTKALAVTKTKDGPIELDTAALDEPPFIAPARAHFGRVVGRALQRDEHRVLAAVVNADNKVMASGGDDPTTPGLSLAGYSSTHTLAGMHAATFLGLLTRTDVGCAALAELYALLADASDSHSSLIEALGAAQETVGEVTWPRTVAPATLREAYPLPEGSDWGELAAQTGQFVRNLLSWNAQGVSKSDTLMSIIDLCALVLTLRLFLWAPEREEIDRRLLLLFSPWRVTADLRQAVARAQESLKLAAARLDDAARRHGLITPMGGSRRGSRRAEYTPSTHAFNLGASGGWLFPLDSRGGAKRYFRPGPRQLMTLVRSIVVPGTELSWREFADRAEHLGIAVGGINEHRTATRLGIRGASESLRRVGQSNREHLVMLGLARQESDNLVIVDGGGS